MPGGGGRPYVGREDEPSPEKLEKTVDDEDGAEEEFVNGGREVGT